MNQITYSTKLIFDSPEDEQKLFQVLEAERFTWNECSKVKFDSVPKNSIVDLHAKFYKSFRIKNLSVPATLVIIAQRSVLSAYRSIKSNKHKIIKECVKKRLSFRLDASSYSYKNGIFSIISLERRVKCHPLLYSKLQELISKYKFCDPLIYVKNNEIWIALTFKLTKIISPQTLALGVDLGSRVFAATSEGNLYTDKVFNKQKRKLRYLKRQLRSKADNGSRSARKHITKLRHKEQNINRNFCHHLANKIIKDTKADVIALEDLKSLKVKKNADKFKKKNRLSQIPFYKIREFLTYKALLNEKTVITVCPKYSSQVDHQTGECDGIRQGRRYYSKLGKIYDSDINAAINIGLRSKLPVSLNSRIETYGQAVVNQPIVNVNPQGILQ